MAFCCHLVQVTVLPGWHCLGQDRTRQHADICMLDLLIGYPENHNLSGQRPTLANTEKKKLHQKSISKKEPAILEDFGTQSGGCFETNVFKHFSNRGPDKGPEDRWDLARFGSTMLKIRMSTSAWHSCSPTARTPWISHGTYASDASDSCEKMSTEGTNVITGEL